MPTKTPEFICPNCASMSIRNHGIQKNKLQTIQRYFCNSCKKTFTQQPVKNKSYTINIILNSILYYNLGYPQTEIQNIISRKFKIKPSQKTISNWLKEYSSICTFSRLRKQAIKLYNNPQYNHSPNNIIHTQTLNHIQPYTFKYHKAKLDILTKENINPQFAQFSALKDYLAKINSKEFPHHIFTYDKTKDYNNNNAYKNNSSNNNNSNKNRDNNCAVSNANEQRASQLKFSHLQINTISKTNLTNQLAKLALNLSNNNQQRHQSIQDFMLINDSTTIATEVPVYLTNWDAGYYRNQKGFVFPLSNHQTPITGHIDILQIRNNLIHILDYKPEATKVKPIEQLTIYALALSRKLNLPLHEFKCAWFDENNYYEFFPLHAVYSKR